MRPQVKEKLAETPPPDFDAPPKESAAPTAPLQNGPPETTLSRRLRDIKAKPAVVWLTGNAFALICLAIALRLFESGVYHALTDSGEDASAGMSIAGGAFIGLIFYTLGSLLFEDTRTGQWVRLAPFLLAFSYLLPSFLFQALTGSGQFLKMFCELLGAGLCFVFGSLVWSLAEPDNTTEPYSAAPTFGNETTLAHSRFTEATPPKVSDSEI